MLLWPSYQAEVIVATPPKRGAASPPWLKALLSPRPKWQMWFYLYILTTVCGAECWESYLKLYKDLADTHWLVELFQFFLFYTGKPSESLLSFACDCCRLPKCYDRCHTGKVIRSLTYRLHALWETRWECLAQRYVSATFQFRVGPFESSDADRPCMHCTKGLVIVTMKYNSSVLSQPFQMYLFLQATIQNICCQLLSFSSRVSYLDTTKKPFFYCTQRRFHHFHKLFTKSHIESSCSKKWRTPQHTSWSLYFKKHFQTTQTNSQIYKLCNVRDLSEEFPDGRLTWKPRLSLEPRLEFKRSCQDVGTALVHFSKAQAAPWGKRCSVNFLFALWSRSHLSPKAHWWVEFSNLDAN